MRGFLLFIVLLLSFDDDANELSFAELEVDWNDDATLWVGDLLPRLKVTHTTTHDESTKF